MKTYLLVIEPGKSSRGYLFNGDFHLNFGEYWCKNNNYHFHVWYDKKKGGKGTNTEPFSWDYNSEKREKLPVRCVFDTNYIPNL